MKMKFCFYTLVFFLSGFPALANLSCGDLLQGRKDLWAPVSSMPLWQELTQRFTAQREDIADRLFFLKKLTPQEIDSIGFYVIGFKGHMRISQALRHPESKTFCPECLHLLNGVKKLPNFKGTVFRAISLNTFPAELKSYFFNLQIGDIYSDMSFTSSSRSKRITNGFRFKGAENGALMIMQSKTGKAIENISPEYQEKEVLFLPQTEFIIINKGRTNDGARVFYLEELDSN